MKTKSKSTSLCGAFFILTFLSTLLSCATYQGKIAHIRDKMVVDPQSSAKELEPLAMQEGKDQLVYLLDHATALQAAGQYKESASQFIFADRLADAKDYLSISKFATSLLFNQEQIAYRGDDFELMMINAMNALNFLMLNDIDGALVETRRINEKLKWISQRTNKSFKKNPFATYLAAVIWESALKFDDAFIDYKSAYELDPSIPTIKEDLVRVAHLAQRTKERDEYAKSFGINLNKEQFAKWDVKKNGSIVVIHLAGWGPRKFPRPEDYRMPMLYPVNFITKNAKLIVNSSIEIPSQTFYSVEDAAIKTFEDEYAELVAKRMAGIVAKEVVTHQVHQKDEAAGILLYIFMHVSDRADLRQWSTLPAKINFIRWNAPAGTYNLKLKSLEDEAFQMNDFLADVKVGKTKFIVWRTFK